MEKIGNYSLKKNNELCPKKQRTILKGSERKSWTIKIIKILYNEL